jgi:hypothetical protein
MKLVSLINEEYYSNGDGFNELVTSHGLLTKSSSSSTTFENLMSND